MLALRRHAKEVVARAGIAALAIFLGGMVFFAIACQAETITSYSGQYAIDLEQKQTLLDSIKEDAEKTEAEMKENADKIKAVKQQKTSYLGLEEMDVAELMPPTEKINIAFAYMSSTLSPESGLKTLKEGESRRVTKE